ncbi:MAG: TolC family protein, partial [Holophaga sp.]|nr:TolC family protein [Holophaga sp.]
MVCLWWKSCRMDCLTLAVMILIFLQAFPAFGADQQVAVTTQDAKVRTFTLADCVNLALQNNVAIRNAYLDRISQRMSLRVAEDKFMPQPSLAFSTITTSTYNTDNTRTQASVQDAKFVTTLTLPTGGAVNFTWDNPANKPDVGQNYSYSSGWSVTFTQPILKNAGIDAATQSVRQERIAEEQAVLDLRDTLVSTITTTITNYRSYMSALRSYDIQVKGLETAKQTLETNKALIAAGRMARTEILQ